MADVEMVERVARAIYASRNGPGAKPWSLLPKAHKSPYLGDARAAIEALREPVMAIIKARETLYEEKASRRDPFREDIANQYDLDKHGAEAMRWLQAEASALFNAILKKGD